MTNRPKGHGHAKDCTCALCERVRKQLAEAKTTAKTRVRFTIDLTRDEVDRILAAGEEYGLGRKPMTERIVREWLAHR